MSNRPTDPRPTEAIPRTVAVASGATCCEDYERAARLSRRRFLTGVAATSGAVVATSVFGDAVRQASFAADGGAGGTGHTLVVISLRGGVDGMGLVVPHGDPGYYAARPHLAVPRGSLIAQDEMFGLHPAMAPLKWMWDAQELAAVHAVGLEVPNRSHFLAMEEVEDADPTSSVRRGWVNRMVGLHAGASPKPSEAVNLGNPITPTALVGSAPTLATTGLHGISLVGATGRYEARRHAQLGTVWRDAPGPLGAAARSAVTTVGELSTVAQQTYRPSVRYPRTYPSVGLSDALQDTAHLVKADVGTEVVSIDYGSWDMHSDYGTTAAGDMQAMVAGLARELSAFLADLGPRRSRVTVVTISEFGRRLAENGNRGLDHGWGNVMLVMGGGVRGGRYYARWPGLDAAALEQGDLSVTTDYRDVLAEVVASRFPAYAATDVFPGLSYSPVGVMAA